MGVPVRLVALADERGATELAGERMASVTR
jgi:hypothetical protein